MLGVDGELLAPARLDNLFSCWAAIAALAARATGDGARHGVVCLFDHEEIGSESTTGAAGPLLATMIERLVRGPRWQPATTSTAPSPARSCVSADMAHAVHPNYPERHEPHHRPLPNLGPVIKVNANQRYATDAASQATFVRACEAAGVPWQVYVPPQQPRLRLDHRARSPPPVSACRSWTPAAPSSRCTRPGNWPAATTRHCSSPRSARSSPGPDRPPLVA